MKKQTTLTKAALIACLVIASSAASHAQTLIDVNIAPDGSTETAAVLGTSSDIYNSFGSGGYVVGAASAGQTLFTNAVSSTGATTGVAIVTSTGFNTYTDSGNNAPINPAFLMDGYAFNETGNGFNGPATTSFTLSGLTAYDGDTFTLVTYGVGNNSGEGNTFTLGGTSTASASTSGANRSITSGAGVAYVEFTGTISGDTLTIAAGNNDTYTGDNSPVTEVNGFQLQLNAAATPEPSTWAMMIGGFGLLFGIARFRNRLQS